MRKPILAALCLALMACSYNLAGSPSDSSSAPPTAKPKLEWRFKDGTTPGADDKVEPPDLVKAVVKYRVM